MPVSTKPSLKPFLLRIGAMLLILVAGTVVLVREVAQGRLEDALERVRGQGEPTSLSEVEWPETGRDARPWLASLNTEFLRLQSLPIGPQDAEGSLDSLSGGEVLGVFSQVLIHGDPEAVRALNSEQRAQLDALMAERAEFDRILAEGRGIEAVHFGEEYRSGAEELIFGQLPIPPFYVNEFLLAEALDAGLRADGSALLEAIRGQQNLARIAYSGPLLIWHALGTSIHSSGLMTLRALLHLVDAGGDPTELVKLLESLDSQESFRRSVLVERAFGLDAFGEIRDGGLGRLRMDGAEIAIGRLLGGSADQANYLEFYESVLPVLRAPWWEGGSLKLDKLRNANRSTFFASFSDALFVNYGQLFEISVDATALRLLALAALAGYAEGIEAAERKAAATDDPFAPRHLSSARQPNGDLLLWSAGPDSLDDKGTGDDVIWRVRKR